MNILIITAHPSSHGFTHNIANTYAEVSRSLGHSVEILNLYNKENRQEFLSFEDKSSNLDTSDRKRMQKKITWADELLFIHPLWWGGPPAIMKNWIDVNLSSKFAYVYENGGPRGLLKGKQGRVIITGGGGFWVYALLLFPFFTIWGIVVFWFCGIWPKSFTYFGSKPTQDEKHLAKWLGKVRKLALGNKGK